MNNDLTNDIVVEQNETTYDRGGNVVLLTRYERFHNPTGTGPLDGSNRDLPRTCGSLVGLHPERSLATKSRAAAGDSPRTLPFRWYPKTGNNKRPWR